MFGQLNTFLKVGMFVASYFDHSFRVWQNRQAQLGGVLLVGLPRTGSSKSGALPSEPALACAQAAVLCSDWQTEVKASACPRGSA